MVIVLTDKRFIIPDELRVIRDTETGEEAIFFDTEDGLLLEKWLNEQHEEIIELREAMMRLMGEMMSGGLR